MSWQSVSCCDDCWWGVQEDGSMAGVGVSEEGPRIPVRIKNEFRELERCHFCGFTTFSGIYVRKNIIDTPPAEPRERRELDV